MTYNLYDSFTIEEAASIGKKFRAKCKANYGYENCLNEGTTYEITITPRILSMTPLCSFIGNEGKRGECHLERFEKVEEVN